MTSLFRYSALSLVLSLANVGLGTSDNLVFMRDERELGTRQTLARDIIVRAKEVFRLSTTVSGLNFGTFKS